MQTIEFRKIEYYYVENYYHHFSYLNLIEMKPRFSMKKLNWSSS